MGAAGVPSNVSKKRDDTPGSGVAVPVGAGVGEGVTGGAGDDVAARVGIGVADGGAVGVDDGISVGMIEGRGVRVTTGKGVSLARVVAVAESVGINGGIRVERDVGLEVGVGLGGCVAGPLTMERLGSSITRGRKCSRSAVRPAGEPETRMALTVSQSIKTPAVQKANPNIEVEIRLNMTSSL